MWLIILLLIILLIFFIVLQYGSLGKLNNKKREGNSKKNIRELYDYFETQRLSSEKTNNQQTNLKRNSKNEIVNNRSTFNTNKVLSENLDKKTKIEFHTTNFPVNNNYSEFYISGTNYLTVEEFSQIDVLEIGEKLFLVSEPTNSYDDRALW